MSSLDQYIAQSGGVFVRVSEFGVECSVCSFKFINTEKRNLVKHISTKRHKLFQEFPKIDGLSPDEMCAVFGLLKDYSFLIRDKDTGEFTCKFCLNAPLSPKREDIRKHEKTRAHVLAIERWNRDCATGMEVEEPRPSTSKQQTVDSRRRQIQNEVASAPKTLGLIIKTDNSGVVTSEDLVCLPCSRIFEAKDLRNSVSKHLLTNAHGNALSGKSPLKPVPEGFEASTLEESPLRKIPATRTCDDTTAANAAKLCLDLDLPSSLADDKAKNIIEKDKTALRRVSGYVIRRRGFDAFFNRIFANRCRYLRDKKMCIMVDETTHHKHIIIGMVIVPLLENAQPFKFRLKEIPRGDTDSVVDFIRESLRYIWPYDEFPELPCDQLITFVTDSANTMKSVGNVLKRTFPKMLTITCVVHAVHIVADKIRLLHPELNKFIGMIKQIMARSGGRNNDFKKQLREKYLSARMPSFPVITRWGTWVIFVNFLHYHFGDFCEFILALDPSNDPTREPDPENPGRRKKGRVRQLQEMVGDPAMKAKLKRHIDFIWQNYQQIPLFVKRLSRNGVPRNEAYAIVTEFSEYIEEAVKRTEVVCPDSELARSSIVVHAKWLRVLGKNTDLLKSEDLAGTNEALDKTPIVTVENERFFHQLRLFGRINQNFKMDNLCKLVVAKSAILGRKSLAKKETKVMIMLVRLNVFVLWD